MSKTKVVLIGAGSTSFGVNTLADLIAQREHLATSHIALCDIDPVRLGRMVRLAERMAAATGAEYTFTSATDYRHVLPGADFVIVSAEQDRVARWKLDWQIPLKYGVQHVLGENGGPGGLSHALRTIDLVLGIAQEVERLAPSAYLINFTNPLPRVCLALTRYTRLKVIGLCHQINKGYYIVGHVLGLVPRLAEHFPPPSIARALNEKMRLETAGLNHFTWIQAMRKRPSGADLYPEFRERLHSFDSSFEPLSRRLDDVFGLFPTSGDDHVGEYFGFAPETSDLTGYDFDSYVRRGADLDTRVEQAVKSVPALSEFLSWESGERGAHVVAAIANDWQCYEEAVNVVNQGALPDMPDWAVVEVPAVLGANGAQPLRVPAFPPAITAALKQQVAIQDRVVEAAVHGDRQAALQALLLDPVVSGYTNAERLLDELLAVHADLLPRFRHRKPERAYE